jgi:hypothetical protein
LQCRLLAGREAGARCYNATLATPA